MLKYGSHDSGNKVAAGIKLALSAILTFRPQDIDSCAMAKFNVWSKFDGPGSICC